MVGRWAGGLIALYAGSQHMARRLEVGGGWWWGDGTL